MFNPVRPSIFPVVAIVPSPVVSCPDEQSSLSNAAQIAEKNSGTSTFSKWFPRSLPLAPKIRQFSTVGFWAAALASAGCGGEAAVLAAGSLAVAAGIGVYLALLRKGRPRVDVGMGLRDKSSAGISAGLRETQYPWRKPVLTDDAKALLSRFEKGGHLEEKERLVLAYALLQTERSEEKLKANLAGLLAGIDSSDLFLAMMEDANAAGDYGYRNDCLRRLAKIAPYIGEERCMYLARRIASKLPVFGGYELPEILAEAARALPAARVLDLMEEIADQYGSDGVRVLPKKTLEIKPVGNRPRAAALSLNSAFSRLFYTLDADVCRANIPRMVENFKHKSPSRRCLAIVCLGAAIQGMPQEDRRAMSLILEEAFGDKNAGVRRKAVKAVGAIHPGLKTEDQLRIVSSLQGTLKDGDAEVRRAAIDAIAAGAGTMGAHSPKLGMLIANRLFNNFEDADTQAYAADALKNRVIPGLAISGRIEFLGLMAGKYKMETPPDIIEETLVRVPPAAIFEHATQTGNEHLAKIAAYHASGLPFAHPRLWWRFIHEKDSGAWLAETSRKLAAYRRGEPILPPVTEEDMNLAYISLGAVKSLSYAEFRRQLRTVPPPAPFLDVPFEGTVGEVREFRGKVDGGKLYQALAPLDNAASVGAFKDYLLRMIRDEKKKGAVKKIRTELEDVFSGNPKDAAKPHARARAQSRWQDTLSTMEVADEKDVLAAVKKLIPMIWKKGSERPIKKKDGMAEADGVRIELPPPLQELLVRLTLLLAWQDVAGADIRKNIETVRAGESVHADVMIKGLKAAEEFYRDRLEDVLKPHDIRGDEIPFIRKHRRLLAAEVERIESVETEKVKVEFIPSCSQIDFFFNRIGEDCARAESVYRSDFQLYRMIVGNNLVGMLYLQKATLGGSKKALVLAIQPRASWQVDHADLLALVRDGLSKVAGMKGYDYLLMMNNVGQQSNRQGMLKAIKAAHLSPISFAAQKTVSAARRERIIAERLHGAGALADMEPPAHWYEVIQEAVVGETCGVSGAVFHGADFLVLWERPAPPRTMPARAELDLDDEDNRLTGYWRSLPAGDEKVEAEEKPAHAEGGARLLTAPVRYPAGARNVVVRMAEEQAIPMDAIAQRVRELLDERVGAPAILRHLYRAPSPTIMAEMTRAFAEAGLQMNPVGVGLGMAEPADQRLLPTNTLAQAGRLVRYGQIVPEGTLVLMHKHPLAIFQNETIIRADRGWLEPTLEGKEVVAFAAPEKDWPYPVAYIARFNEDNVVTPQDLYDFYNIVFHQGLHFRAFLILLRNRGADISHLAPIVERLSELLSWGLEHLLQQEFDEALQIFKEADRTVTEFRAVMNEIAATVGLEIDPVTGEVKEKR